MQGYAARIDEERSAARIDCPLSLKDVLYHGQKGKRGEIKKERSSNSSPIRALIQ